VVLVLLALLVLVVRCSVETLAGCWVKVPECLGPIWVPVLLLRLLLLAELLLRLLLSVLRLLLQLLLAEYKQLLEQ
jgi:hypothetical protein